MMYTPTMRVYDFYSGWEGWSKPFREAGHNVTSIDIEKRFNPDWCMDILQLKPEDVADADVILASPPCEAFSVASIGTHWTGGAKAYEPFTAHARLSLQLVTHTQYIINTVKPKWWVMENPRGLLRKLITPPTATTWYCQWGTSRAKPTDIWTNLTGRWPTCYNGCLDHDQQSRYYSVRKALGQNGGTQGMVDTAARAVIPYQLASEVLHAVTNDGRMRLPVGYKNCNLDSLTEREIADTVRV